MRIGRDIRVNIRRYIPENKTGKAQRERNTLSDLESYFYRPLALRGLTFLEYYSSWKMEPASGGEVEEAAEWWAAAEYEEREEWNDQVREQLLDEILGAMTNVELKENWDYIKQNWDLEEFV